MVVGELTHIPFIGNANQSHKNLNKKFNHPQKRNKLRLTGLSLLQSGFSGRQIEHIQIEGQTLEILVFVFSKNGGALKWKVKTKKSIVQRENNLDTVRD